MILHWFQIGFGLALGFMAPALLALILIGLLDYLQKSREW